MGGWGRWGRWGSGPDAVWVVVFLPFGAALAMWLRGSVDMRPDVYMVYGFCCFGGVVGYPDGEGDDFVDDGIQCLPIALRKDSPASQPSAFSLKETKW